MPDPMRAAILNGLPNRFLSVSFPRVNGDVEILTLYIVKSVHGFLGRIAAFLPGEVEAHDSTCPKVDGEFGHLERHVHVAHGADDQSRPNSAMLARAIQTLQ